MKWKSKSAANKCPLATKLPSSTLYIYLSHQTLHPQQISAISLGQSADPKKKAVCSQSTTNSTKLMSMLMGEFFRQRYEDGQRIDGMIAVYGKQ